MLTKEEHWQIPELKKPPAVKVIRTGPKPKFEPIRNLKPAYAKPYIIQTWGEIHADKEKKPKTEIQRKRSIWDPELKQRAIDLAGQGLSAAEIGRQIGKGMNSIYYMLKANGFDQVTLHPRKAPKQSRWTPDRVATIRKLAKTMTCSQIAKEFSVKTDTMRHVLEVNEIKAVDGRKYQGTWTEEEDALLMKLAAEGLSGYKISEIMGRSRQSVYNRQQRLEDREAIRKLWST